MKAISGKRGLWCNGTKSSALPNFLTVLNQWSSSISPGDNNAIAKRCHGSIISQLLALGKLMKAGPDGAVPVIVLFSSVCGDLARAAFAQQHTAVPAVLTISTPRLDSVEEQENNAFFCCCPESNSSWFVRVVEVVGGEMAVSLTPTCYHAG